MPQTWLGACAGHVAQQVGIHRMPERGRAQMGSRRNAGDAHLVHVPLNGFTVDDHPLSLQHGGDSPRPIEGIGGVLTSRAIMHQGSAGQGTPGVIGQNAPAWDVLVNVHHGEGSPGVARRRIS